MDKWGWGKAAEEARLESRRAIEADAYITVIDQVRACGWVQIAIKFERALNGYIMKTK